MTKRRISRDSSKTTVRISPVEKGVAYALAISVVIVLIFLVLSPRAMNDGTLAIVRFLAALAGAVAAGLFLGEVKAQGAFNRLSIRASGGFAIFIIIFLLFFYGIPKLNESTTGKPISFRYLTGINDYPALTLSILNPGMHDEIALKILSRFLGIQNPATVYSKNPVFESLQRFKFETGNEKTLLNQNKFQYLLYSSNSGEKSDTGLSDAIDLHNLNKDLPFNSRRKADFKGEDDTFTFHYAPILIPFQTSAESGEYTTLFEGERNSFIVQYPKLSDLGKFGIRDNFSYQFSPSLKDIWINKVVQRNPEVRGFFAFAYPYADSIQEFSKILAGCRNVGGFVTRLMPSPYVKFLDIENTTTFPISIDTVDLKILEKDEYELTSVDNRDVLFKNVEGKSQKFGIQLKPKHHVFIPVEFGFDTKPQRDIFKSASQNDTDRLIPSFSRVYVSKPVLESKRCSSEDKNCAKYFSQVVNVNAEFKSSFRTPEELVRKVPSRFSVGSLISINSIKVNDTNIEIPPPQSDPKFLMSAMFNEGSCPFLLAYNPSKKTWIDLGTVISNRNSKLLKGTDKYVLDDEVRKIRLEERESEVSYIDSVEFTFEDLNAGQAKKVSPKVSSLSKIDGDYIILHKGDSFEVDFSQIIPADAANLKIRINGYYEVVQDALNKTPMPYS
jgi:hypothetical protein